MGYTIRSQNAVEAEAEGLVNPLGMGDIGFRFNSEDLEASGIIEAVFGLGNDGGRDGGERPGWAAAGGSFWKPGSSLSPGNRRRLHALKDEFTMELGRDGNLHRDYSHQLGHLADSETLVEGNDGKSWFLEHTIRAIDTAHVVWCEAPAGSTLRQQGFEAVAMRIWPDTFQGKDGTFLASVQGPRPNQRERAVIQAFRLFKFLNDAQEDLERTQAALLARAQAHSDAYLASVWSVEDEEVSFEELREKELAEIQQEDLWDVE